MITKPTIYKNLLTYLIFIVCLYLPVSCSYQEERESRSHIQEAEIVMENSPQDALSQLQHVNTGLLNEDDYAYFILLQARALSMTKVNISTLEPLIDKSKLHFIKKNHAEKVALAYFVTAKLYYSQEKYSIALYSYQQAHEWAERVNNRMPHFIYSHIPYNIALLYFREQQYDESIEYLKKAISYADKEQCRYTQKLHMYELMALNYQFLGDIEKALDYFEESYAIATLNEDMICQNRILYNKCALLYNTKEYTYAEEKVNEQLPFSIQANDSIVTGMLYMTLARIHAKSNRIESASDNMYRSNEYLANTEEGNVKIALYEQLYLIEQQNGNTSKAALYQKQYNSLKEELSNIREAETAELVLEKEINNYKGEAAYQMIIEKGTLRNMFRKHQKITNITFLVIGILFLVIGIVYYIKRYKQNQKEYDYCIEDMMLFISQRNLINSIKEELDHLEDSECKRNVIDIADDAATVLKIAPSFDRKFRKLYYKLKEYYPTFTENELTVCWIAYTHIAPSQIKYYMGISEKEFNEIWVSMNKKIIEAGHNLKFTNSFFIKFKMRI